MKKGFTLVEIIISVGILAIVGTLIAQVVFTTAHVNKKTEILTDIKQDGNFALDVIGRMVRSAKAIECLSGTSAKITAIDNTVTTLECLSVGNTARIASESASHPTVYLTSGNVTLSSSGDCNNTIAFVCAPAVGIKNQVTVTFRLGQLGVAGSAYESGSASFQSTISMRN